MNSLILQSPAKLNLFLKIINKREDGYHNLITLFERISLFDEIYLESNNNGKIIIICDHPSVPRGSKNTVFKIIKLLKDEMKIKNGVKVRIKKKIPIAAGLAGGSSNAATVLLGLNKLWSLNLSERKLLYFAKQVGSDVPFFLYNSSWAIGTERGDKIRKINIKNKLWHILVVPCVKMYAKDVYKQLKSSYYYKNFSSSARCYKSRKKAKMAQKPDLTNMLTKANDNVNILIRNLSKNANIQDIGNRLINDLEPAIFKLNSRILKLKQSLKSLDINGVTISGSGPAVYGLTANEKEAKYFQKIVSKKFKQVFVVKTL